jgi:hypothetical protein
MRQHRAERRCCGAGRIERASSRDRTALCGHITWRGIDPCERARAPEINRAVTAFARSANGGIVTTSGLALVHRELIIALAARYKLPAVYYRRYVVTTGGLLSYRYDLIDMNRRAALELRDPAPQVLRSRRASLAAQLLSMIGPGLLQKGYRLGKKRGSRHRPCFARHYRAVILRPVGRRPCGDR